MSEELKLFASHIDELEKFRGKHVAMIKDKVVVAGDSAIGVLQEARKKFPGKKPVLAFIPKEETLILILRCN